MDITGLKYEYNGLLKRFEAGSKYMDDNSIPIAEREEKQPAFRRILDRLNGILFELKENGVSYVEVEVLNGFNIESEENVRKS